jgi:16S rRNA (guanine966-N2)-methyltransferase
MKITGGVACGRSIAVPNVHGVRPTGSKMRQALFNILGSKVRKAEVLDLFAGSGLMGFEALSRGANSLTSVEKNFICMHCLEVNAQKLGYREKMTLVRDDFRRAVDRLEDQQFDIIFADPPYRSDYAQQVVTRVAENRLLKKDGIVVIEHLINTTLIVDESKLCLIECRPYSQSAFSFFTTVKV